MTEEELEAYREEEQKREAQAEQDRMDRLKDTVEIYKVFLANLEKIREEAKKFDGKVVNVRFVKAMTAAVVKSGVGINVKVDRVLAWTELRVEISQWKYYDDTEFDAYIEGAIVDKRLDYEKFCKKMDNNISNLKDLIAQLEEDIRTGNERRERYNELAKEMEMLGKSFSSHYKTIYKYQFEDLIYGKIN